MEELKVGDKVSFNEPEAIWWEGIITHIDEKTGKMSAKGINGYLDIIDVMPGDGYFVKLDGSHEAKEFERKMRYGI